ncbi:flagellar biosynthesis protein FlgA [Amycolatopsis magusensis]|uniref:flagellar biosynthesis protein FlgA n=1 Tax=Amycolatopsis magusensis TaxID=882444 RepID=UPI00379FD8CB
MTTTAKAPEVELPRPPVPRPLRRRPSKILLLVGLLTAALCATGSVFIYRGVDTAEAAIGLAQPIRFGQTITAEALLEVQVRPEPGVQPMPWSKRAEFVGKKAATDLWPGGLLVPQAVQGPEIPAPGQQLVGIAVKPPQLPATPLEPRQFVLLVPSGPEAAEWEPVRGSVVRIGDRDASGIRVVDVLVADRAGPRLATRASTGAVAIVLLPGS